MQHIMSTPTFPPSWRPHSSFHKLPLCLVYGRESQGYRCPRISLKATRLFSPFTGSFLGILWLPLPLFYSLHIKQKILKKLWVKFYRNQFNFDQVAQHALIFMARKQPRFKPIYWKNVCHYESAYVKFQPLEAYILYCAENYFAIMKNIPEYFHL